MRTTRPSALRCALLALLVTACGSDRPHSPRNVVLICLDTVRADHLGCYGYEQRTTTPNLDALASRSTLLSAVSATACWTKPSVPSFLTGTFPMQHGVYLGSSRDEAGASSDVLPAEAFTLAEAFQEAGYRTAAFVKNAQLRKGLGMEQGFETYVDEAGDAREIRWRASDWLEARDTGKPFFLYLHLLDAHMPYTAPAEYATRFASSEAVEAFRSEGWRELRDAVNHGERVLEPAEIEALVALYDGALAWIDEELGLLFKKLEHEGLADDTVVCVIADHGEEFMEHGRIGHGHGLWENLLHVPWILHIPGEQSRRIDAAASLIDLFPTLLAAAGVESARPSAGVDRIHEPTGSEAIFAEHLEPGSYQQSLARAGTKLVRSVRPVEGSVGAAVPAALPALSEGSRWEAKIERDARGGLHATLLRPSADPASDPTEIKGSIERVEAGRILIDGLAIGVGASTELFGETRAADGSARVLEAGMLVKAVGSTDREAVFQATRVKLYSAGEKAEQEIRGVLETVDPGGFIVIAGVRLSYDEHTEVAGGAADAKPRMSRAEVARFLDAEASENAADGFATSASVRDLVRDPGELAPAQSTAAPLDDLLRFSRSPWSLRRWGVADRTTLSASDLDALRAIGYAE